MYRRYTLDEVKRKIVDALQTAGGTGLSGVELAERTGTNRMTVTKYLDVMNAMGLVKKNSIVLVDYTNQLRKEGKSVEEAVLTACPVRLRPIVMTSIATIMAAVPAARRAS